MNNIEISSTDDIIEIEILPTHTETTILLEDSNEYDYEKQFNLPKINSIELKGNKSGDDLGLVNKDELITLYSNINEIKHDTDSTKQITDLNTNQIDVLKEIVADNKQIADKDINEIATETETLKNNLEALTGDVENLSAEIDYKINRAEVEHLIAQIQQFKHQKVDELPKVGSEAILYLVPTQTGIYEEYIWLDSEQKYEDIGSTAIDLSEYAKLTDIPTNFVTTTQLVTLSTQTARYDLSNVSSNIDYVISEQTYGGGESGKRKRKNGRFEQWGVATTSDTGEVEFTIHEAFKDMLFSVFVEPREKGNFFHYAYPSAIRKFKTRITDITGTPRAIKVQWKAEGYWK